MTNKHIKSKTNTEFIFAKEISILATITIASLNNLYAKLIPNVPGHNVLYFFPYIFRIYKISKNQRSIIILSIKCLNFKLL